MTRPARIPFTSRRLWTWLLLAALAAALLYAAPLIPLRQWIADFQSWAAGLGPIGVLLFAVVYIACALLLGPCWLVTLAIGLTYGVVRGVALVSVVSTIGAALAFLIGRHLARRKVEEFLRKNPRFAAIDRAVEKSGWKIVSLLRLSAIVPYTVSNYVYGATAIRFWPYVAASWAGMLPLTVLYVSIGAAGRAATVGASPWHRAALGAGILVTGLVTLYIARISRRELARARLADIETGQNGQSDRG